MLYEGADINRKLVYCVYDVMPLNSCTLPIYRHIAIHVLFYYLMYVYM